MQDETRGDAMMAAKVVVWGLGAVMSLPGMDSAWDRAQAIVDAHDSVLDVPRIRQDVVTVLGLVMITQARQHSCSPSDLRLPVITRVLVSPDRTLATLGTLLDGTPSMHTWVQLLAKRSLDDTRGSWPWLRARRAAAQAVGAEALVQTGGVRLGDAVAVLPDWGEEDRPTWYGIVSSVDWSVRAWDPACPDHALVPDLLSVRAENGREEPVYPGQLLLPTSYGSRATSQALSSARQDLQIAAVDLDEDDDPARTAAVLARRIPLFVDVPEAQQMLQTATAGPQQANHVAARLRRILDGH